MVADLSRVYLKDLDTAFQETYLQYNEDGSLQNMFVSKQFCVKLNKHITVQDSRKKFNLMWKNDKRQIVKKEEEEKWIKQRERQSLIRFLN